MFKIDAIDRKILYELGKDARQSYSALGTKVRSSKEVVQYRVSNLLRQGVIFRLLPIIDTSRIGYGLNKVFIKLQNASEKRRAQLIASLLLDNRVIWLVECDGAFDIAFMIFAKTHQELDRAIRELCGPYSYFINRKELSTNVAGEYFERRYLIDAVSTLQKKVSYGNEAEGAALSAQDRKILELLAGDARLQSTQLAKTLPIKSDAVRQHLRRMEEQGIITSYSLILDNASIGQIQYKVLIELEDLSESVLQGIRQFCIQTPRIVYMIKALGRWDVEIDIEASCAQEYRDIMSDFSKTFPGKIKMYESLIIYKIHEYRYIPEHFALQQEKQPLNSMKNSMKMKSSYRK